MNRHGLIAGATGTGKTKTLQLMAEQLSAQGVPVFVADIKGDVSGLPAGRGRRSGREAQGRAGAAISTSRVPGRVPVARRHRPGRSGPRDGLGLRPAAARQGARRQRDAGASLGLVFRFADTTGCRYSTSPTCGRCSPTWSRRRARPSWRARRGLEGDGRRAAARARRARDRRRQRVLRRATAGHRRPHASPPTGAACLVPRAGGRAGQARAVLDRADVAGGRAVRGAARGRRPRKPKLVFFLDEAHLLFDDATEAFLEAVTRRCG